MLPETYNKTNVCINLYETKWYLYASSGIVERCTLAEQSLLQLVAVHVQYLLAFLEITQHVYTIAVVFSRYRPVDDRHDGIGARILWWEAELGQLNRMASCLCSQSLLNFISNVAGNFGCILAVAR